jgi:hypothetical protein
MQVYVHNNAKLRHDSNAYLYHLFLILWKMIKVVNIALVWCASEDQFPFLFLFIRNDQSLLGRMNSWLLSAFGFFSTMDANCSINCSYPQC